MVLAEIDGDLSCWHLDRLDDSGRGVVDLTLEGKGGRGQHGREGIVLRPRKDSQGRPVCVRGVHTSVRLERVRGRLIVHIRPHVPDDRVRGVRGQLYWVR